MSLLYDLKPTDLISLPYCALQKALHAQPQGYGGKGDKWASAVVGLIQRFRVTSVLDYGCGEGALAKALRAQSLGAVRIEEYDPAITGKEGWPQFADLVVCTDVLEHIEPEKLGVVLQHLAVLARRAVFVVIAQRPSNKTMADGRNAHLIVESAEWWAQRFADVGLVVQPDPPVSPLRKASREWVAVLTGGEALG